MGGALARIDRGLLRGGRTKQLASQEVRPIAHKLIAIVRSYFQHCDYGLVLICCLPLGILAFDRRWLFYSVFGYIDPWIYFGYFLRLRYHLRMFPHVYYGSRLPWILPGSVVYHLFPPSIAVYVLHGGLYYVAVISLYLILKNTVHQRAAVLTALLMGGHCFFLAAIGWDYVDGAGIAYFLLTLLMLTYATKHWRAYVWVVLGGIFYGAFIYSHLFLITFTPVIALFYLFASRHNNGHRLCRSVVFFGLGWLGLTVLLGLLNYLMNGVFLFFAPSFKIATELVTKGNPWRASGFAWVNQAAWLICPALTLVSSMVVLLLRDRVSSLPNSLFPILFQVLYIISALIMIAWELVRQPVLLYSYYASFLLPTMFLAIGAQLGLAVKRVEAARFGALIVAMVALLLLSYSLPVNSRFLTTLKTHSWAPVFLGGSALLLAVVRPSYFSAAPVLLLCAAFGTLNLSASMRNSGWGDRALAQSSFLVIAESMRAVQNLNPQGTALFWYDLDGPLGGIGRAVASTYLWPDVVVSERFPMLDSKLSTPTPRRRVFVFSNDQYALEKADRSLSKIGLKAQFLDERTIQKGRLSCKITLVEMRYFPAREGELGAGQKQHE